MTAWTDQWISAAERSVLVGDRSLDANELTDTCRHYLRAAEYYRLALRGANQGSPERRAWREAQADLFRAAAPLLPHPSTMVDGSILPAYGYLFRPLGRPGPWSAAIVTPSASSVTVESLYEATAVPILELGMACGIFGWVDDAEPGQVDGREAPLVEWVAAQPGIDPDRIWLAPG